MAQGCQVDIRSGQSRTELLQRLKGKKPNILQTVGFDLVHQMGQLEPVPDKNKENSSVAFLKDLRRLEDGVEQMSPAQVSRVHDNKSVAESVFVAETPALTLRQRSGLQGPVGNDRDRLLRE